MKILSASSPSWANPERSGINVDVEIAGIGVVLFGASPADTAAHGRDLYARAVAGEFGPVAEYVAPVQPIAQQQASLTAVVQEHLDAVARAKGYDSILSAVSYVGSQIFGAEAVNFRDWRDAVWKHCYDVEAAVNAGTRSLPQTAELISELPEFPNMF